MKKRTSHNLSAYLRNASPRTRLTLLLSPLLLVGTVVLLGGDSSADSADTGDAAQSPDAGQAQGDPARTIDTRTTDRDANRTGSADSSAVAGREERDTQIIGPREFTPGRTTETVRDDQSNLLARAELNNGKPSGQFTSYHQNGWAMMDGPQKNGRPDGQWTAWHQNGVIAFQGEFVDGKRHGTWMYWDTDGVKKRRENYSNGARAGKWTYWDARGNVWLEEDFRQKRPARQG